MRTVILLGVLLFFSCNRDERIAGKETQLVFMSNPLGDNTSLNHPAFQTLDLFAIDRDSRIVRHEHFTQNDLHENTLQTLLPLGRYRLACIANCSGINFDPEGTLTTLLLHLPQSGAEVGS